MPQSTIAEITKAINLRLASMAPNRLRGAQARRSGLRRGQITSESISSITIFLASLALTLFTSSPAEAKTQIWRLDCGDVELLKMDEYSDTFEYVGRQKTLTASCYVIKNGDRFLLWDTGLPSEFANRKVTQDGMNLLLRRSVRDQLTQIGVTPEQIEFVGLSHYHFDHTGQAAGFPGATLLIGARDWDAVKARSDRSKPLLPWTEGGSAVVPTPGDHDVFGDGQVMMLATPGHTPGHRSLLVRLQNRGPVLLTGDLWHFSENLLSGGMPQFNSSRSETLASMDRLNRIAKNLNATVIIQHDPNDITKLPTFPEMAD